jgi:hypothetical protein
LGVCMLPPGHCRPQPTTKGSWPPPYMYGGCTTSRLASQAGPRQLNLPKPPKTDPKRIKGHLGQCPATAHPTDPRAQHQTMPYARRAYATRPVTGHVHLINLAAPYPKLLDEHLRQTHQERGGGCPTPQAVTGVMCSVETSTGEHCLDPPHKLRVHLGHIGETRHVAKGSRVSRCRRPGRVVDPPLDLVQWVHG